MLRAALRLSAERDPYSLRPSNESSWSAWCGGAGSVSARSICSSNGHWNEPLSASESPYALGSSDRPASQPPGPLPAWRRSLPDVSESRWHLTSTFPQLPQGPRTSAARCLPADCHVPARHRSRRQTFLRDRPIAQRTYRCQPSQTPSLLDFACNARGVEVVPSQGCFKH